jgi:glycine oxidase
MADIVIAGAGIIGLALALELERRGARVTVLEAGKALGQASTAAAGMLSVGDPKNPAELLPLSRLSRSLYPEFLDRLESLSGDHVAFQTAYVLEASDEPTTDEIADVRELLPQLVTGGRTFHVVDEQSVDPRQLAAVLAAAVRARAERIELREESSLARIAATKDGVNITTSDGQSIAADYVVDCMGAWSPAPVAPVKGQMLAVALPEKLPLEAVVRTKDIYIVPRTSGPNAGRAIIGATIEKVGFDKEIHALDILTLHAKATALLPQLKDAEFLESWAGLRPGTADGLPLLGASAGQPRYVLANGHFRNGILLAPGTARVMAQVLAGETPEVSLEEFQPARFSSR